MKTANKRAIADRRSNEYRRLCVLWVQAKHPDISVRLKAAAFRKFPSLRKRPLVSELPKDVL